MSANMALLDFFKRKRRSGSDKSQARREEHFQKPNSEPEEKEEKSETGFGFKEKNQASEKAFKVLLSPLVTEKSTESAEAGVYIFKISEKVNKDQIRDAVQELYGVNVRKVNLVRLPAKKRFSRGRTGIRPGYRKALVFLESGQKIEVI